MTFSTNKLDAELYCAVRQNNEPEVRRLLAEGANPNASLKHSVPCVLAACKTGASPGVVSALLAYGGNANGFGNGGDTPLHFASLRGDFEQVSLLLEAGADPLEVDRLGLYPIDVAGSGAVLRRLVQWGVDLFRVHEDGSTILHRLSSPDAVAEAIELGADPFALDGQGKSPEQCGNPLNTAKRQIIQSAQRKALFSAIANCVPHADCRPAM